MSVQIPLTQNKVAIVDDEDAERVLAFRWYAYFSREKWYAQRVVQMNGKRQRIALHRFILDAPEGDDVDHRDGDGLNNQHANLRIATKSQNMWNRPKSRNNTSGFKGVYLHRQLGKWEAGIRHNNKRHYLGVFDTPEAAAHAYDKAARELHGEFARCNFPN